jgi:glycosyltransferase involved in cell wall biosynthesis
MTPLVSVCCITYNHAPYIKKTLQSFITQETTFPYEVIVHDDASTDDTQRIILEFAHSYPGLFRLILQSENQHSKGIRTSFTTFRESTGDYIAFCEGDDYWSDPNKLQRQVDFLEQNPSFGFIHSDVDEYNTTNNTWRRAIWKAAGYNKVSGDIYDAIMAQKGIGIYLCTSLFRAHFVRNNLQYEDVLAQNFPYGDAPLTLHIARQSEIHYMPESTAVRNLLPWSASQGRDFAYTMRFRTGFLEVHKYFENLRPSKTGLEPVARRFRRVQLDVCYGFGRLVEYEGFFKALPKDEKCLSTHLMRLALHFPALRFLVRILLRMERLKKSLYLRFFQDL